jgi:hypothetical protein
MVLGLGNQKNVRCWNHGALRHARGLCCVTTRGRQPPGRPICGAKRRRPGSEIGPPASTFKMNSGDTSYIWQLGNQTNINTDRGSGIASTQYCKVSVIASKTGVVSQLNTDDSNAGAGLGSALGMYGSICANRLGMERQT